MGNSINERRLAGCTGNDDFDANFVNLHGKKINKICVKMNYFDKM